MAEMPGYSQPSGDLARKAADRWQWLQMLTTPDNLLTRFREASRNGCSSAPLRSIG
ncbi:MAG: hypothetical protein WA957_08795 [Alteraurantiacibacter sp.]